MAPIVHGLEQQLSARIDFVYLDVADSANDSAKAKLGFRATPPFVLLDGSGAIRWQRQGAVPADTLRQALETALPPGNPSP